MTAPRSVDRVDAHAKVTGAAHYTGDLTVENVAHGHLVLSTIARGAIRSMHTREAECSPGVLAVYTPFNPLELHVAPPSFLTPSWEVLQDVGVRHWGQPIGLVVAETPEQARAAAGLITVDYDPERATVAFQEGMAGAFTPSHVLGEAPVIEDLAAGDSDIGQAVAEAPVGITSTYSTATNNHAAMEPHPALAWWEGDDLIVHTATQGVLAQRQFLATALNVEPARVRVVDQFMGGGFGGKVQAFAHTKLAAAAARALGRPVRVVLSRPQVFTATALRGPTVQRVALGADADGHLVAIEHSAWSGVSSAEETPFVEPVAHSTSLEWYDAGSRRIAQWAVPLDIPQTFTMRGPGEGPGSFALESAMDELAVALDLDPVELRIRNDTAVHPHLKVPYSSKHLTDCLRVGAEKFGWHRRTAPRSTVDGDWLVGLGMAVACYPAKQRPGRLSMTLHADGRIVVATAAADLGTGTRTVLALLAADGLGVPVDRIEVEIGDSLLPPAPTAAASAGTASIAPTVAKAVEAARTALVDMALEDPHSPLQGCAPSQTRWANGGLRAGALGLSFETLLKSAGRDRLEVTGAHQPGQDLMGFSLADPEPTEHSSPHAYASFGAQFCEVRVHRRTAEVRVARMLAVMDVGKVVNHKTARSQILGAMVGGLSAALHEALEFEPSGRPVNPNLAEYLIPVHADIGSCEVHFLDSPDTIFNPAGVRGAGEIGLVGVAAAIGNAVFNATGARIRHLPIRLEDLLEHL